MTDESHPVVPPPAQAGEPAPAPGPAPSGEPSTTAAAPVAAASAATAAASADVPVAAPAASPAPAPVTPAAPDAAVPAPAVAPSPGVMLAPTAPRKPQGVHWTLPLVVVALGSLGGLWGMYGSLLTHPTRGVPGDAERFDPIAALPKVLDYAGAGAQLVSVAALFVRQDGTMDLTATPSPSPTAIYTFARESRDSKATGSKYETVTIMVAEPFRTVSFGSGEDIDTYVCRGMDRTVSHGGNVPTTKAPVPACSLAEMFNVALSRGATAGALANVLYGPGGYTFTITSPRLSLQFGTDCQPK